MQQISPADSAEQQSIVVIPNPTVYVEATPGDLGACFVNLVIAGLPEPAVHREAIDKILHAIRHYGAHGDSSGCTASQRKLERGEPLENERFRFFISYYFLPLTSGATNSLVIQITQNHGGQARILNGNTSDKTPIPESAKPNISFNSNEPGDHITQFINSAPDESTTAFRRWLTGAECANKKQCKIPAKPQNPDLPGRAMTADEQRQYFSYMVEICLKYVTDYVEKVFTQNHGNLTLQTAES